MLHDGMLPAFRDAEDVVLDLLEGFFNPAGYDRVVWMDTETFDGDRFEHSLPFIRVGRTGGAPRRGDEHTDAPVIDIDVLATTRREAKQIADTIQQLLVSTPYPIDVCNVLMSPQKVGWQEGSPLRRFYASYHLALRR